MSRTERKKIPNLTVRFVLSLSIMRSLLCFGSLLLFLLLLSLALGEEHRSFALLSVVLLPHVVENLGDDGHVLAAVIQCALGNIIFHLFYVFHTTLSFYYLLGCLSITEGQFLVLSFYKVTNVVAHLD